MNRLFFSFIMLVLVALPMDAMAANDQELYDPKPPADASFVRFVNISDAEMEVSGGGIAAQKLASHAVGAFYVVKQGTHSFKHGAVAKDLTIEPQKYYTVAVNGTDAMVVEDTISENPAKAVLYFYNFTDKPALSLFAPKHNTAIFDGVKAGEGASREINPLELELEVREGDASLAKVPAVSLKRRTGFSIFAISGKDNVEAVSLENAIGK